MMRMVVGGFAAIGIVSVAALVFGMIADGADRGMLAVYGGLFIVGGFLEVIAQVHRDLK